MLTTRKNARCVMMDIFFNAGDIHYQMAVRFAFVSEYDEEVFFPVCGD